jgi:hypothetical protein
LSIRPTNKKPTRRFILWRWALELLSILYFAQLIPRQKGVIRVPEPVWGRIDELIFWLV